MKTDILILGGGLAGICAAYEIVQNTDRKVDLLCCGGGASPYIHGFCLPIGEGDSEQLFFNDSMESGYHQNRKALVGRLCRDSLALPEYFRSLGLDVDRDGDTPRLIRSLGSSVPRIAGIGNNTGPVMLSTLRKKLATCEHYREHKNLRALELIKKDARVTGVRCYDKDTDTFRTIGASVVILATGGFGRLFPESTNSQDIGGDGCAMAYLAGGRMTDMEFVQFEPSAAVWPPELAGKSIITTMFYEGAVLRGGDGKRFADEKDSKDVLAKAISREMLKGNATPHGGVWFDATAVPAELWNGIYKPYHSRYLAHGIDMAKEPVEIAPAAHTTCGGLLIDENCRTGIPGLLACGEVTGGLHGANRLGGNAGLETMIFGRIAGQTAFTEWGEAEAEENICKNRVADVNIKVMREILSAVLRRSLGVIRREEGLRQGIEQIDELLIGLGDHTHCFEKHRLYNDLITARMALLSALARKGSVGCHYREDSAAECPFRAVVENHAGHMTVLREEI